MREVTFLRYLIFSDIQKMLSRFTVSDLRGKYFYLYQREISIKEIRARDPNYKTLVLKEVDIALYEISSVIFYYVLKITSKTEQEKYLHIMKYILFDIMQ
jgi:hypothetical protein